MMSGVMTAQREAVLQLTLYNSAGQPHQINGTVDTGFTAWLTLPPNIIAALGLRFQRSGRGTLADGSTIAFRVYEATVLWDGQPLVVPVNETNGDMLIGISLMYGYHLDMPIVDGGSSRCGAYKFREHLPGSALPLHGWLCRNAVTCL